MNKLLLSFAFCLTTITSFAQEAADRMMVHQKDGSVRSYAISNVDSVTFGKSDVQGDVTVTVLATMGSLAYGSATMPEGCRNGDIALIPNDGTVTDYSAYIRSHSTIKMTQATNTWSYSTLEPAGRYIVAAQAYDDMGAVVGMGYTELNPGTGDVVDLGEGANTYIVPAKGRYSFMPLHIDGSRISGISSVDWLWSTRTSNQNSAQGLVSDIQIEDNGRISFDATGEKGSVVFAAFDADNKVIWTWLIWCTDKPATMRYANGVEFMDRNMGAISANPEDGTDTWGLLWQWGRITPFFGGYAENEWEASDAFKESKAWTVVNQAYDYQWAYKLEGTSIEGAIAAPFTLFNDDLTCDWHVPADLTLWSSTTKTNYDPCPAGYRLPSASELAVLYDIDLAADGSGYTYTYNGNTAWWPSSGSGREFDTGCNIIGKSTFFLWSASAEYVNNFLMGYSDFPAAYRFTANNNTRYNNVVGNRAFAHAIRCVVDSKK